MVALFVIEAASTGNAKFGADGYRQVLLNGAHTPHLMYGVAGLGVDLAFGLFGYKRNDVLVVALAGLAAGMFWYPIFYVTHAVYLYPTSFIVIDLIARSLGSTIGNGLLGAAVGIATLGAVRRASLLSYKASQTT